MQIKSYTPPRIIDLPFEIIINAESKRRKLAGSFEICGSADILRSIASQILKQVTDEDGKNRFSYGWVTVYSDLPHQAEGETFGWQ